MRWKKRREERERKIYGLVVVGQEAVNKQTRRGVVIKEVACDDYDDAEEKRSAGAKTREGRHHKPESTQSIHRRPFYLHLLFSSSPVQSSFLHLPPAIQYSSSTHIHYHSSCLHPVITPSSRPQLDKMHFKHTLAVMASALRESFLPLLMAGH